MLKGDLRINQIQKYLKQNDGLDPQNWLDAEEEASLREELEILLAKQEDHYDAIRKGE